MLVTPLFLSEPSIRATRLSISACASNSVAQMVTVNQIFLSGVGVVRQLNQFYRLWFPVQAGFVICCVIEKPVNQTKNYGISPFSLKLRNSQSSSTSSKHLYQLFEHEAIILRHLLLMGARSRAVSWLPQLDLYPL